VQESIEAEQQRRFIADEENAKWWSAFESGNVIEVDDSDAEHGGATYGDAEPSSSLHTSLWDKISDDDGGADGGDEADNDAPTSRL
jgi:hypothetical protein